MRRFVISGSILIGLLLATTLTLAQSGGGFAINGFSFGAGLPSSGGDFTLSGGPSSMSGASPTGGDFSVSSGFWQCRDENAIAPQDVTITRTNQTDAALSWSLAGVYAVWQSNDPYFEPNESGSSELLNDVTAVPVNANGFLGSPNTASYLVVMGLNDCNVLSSETSNRVGVFNFGITPGS